MNAENQMHQLAVPFWVKTQKDIFALQGKAHSFSSAW